MLLELYSIRDIKVGTFGQPLAFANIVELTRALTQVMSKKDTNLSLYPEDYTLYLVGKFNQDEGKIVVDPSGPVFVQNLTAFIPTQK